MKLLHVDSSITPNSISRQVSAAIAERIRSGIPDIETVYRDLTANPLPHFTSADLPAESDPQHAAANIAVLQEFLDADHVVIGAPMYNFNIPSQLKTWIDRLTVAGKTFRYTEHGPMGMVGGKKIYVASSRGSFYGPDSPNSHYDHQESYLALVFRFFGITDLTFVRAEGATSSPETRARATEKALEEARRLQI